MITGIIESRQSRCLIGLFCCGLCLSAAIYRCDDTRMEDGSVPRLLCATYNGSHKSQKDFFIGPPPPPQPSGVILLTYNASVGNRREQENLQPFYS